jgi:hypothetical protein
MIIVVADHQPHPLATDTTWSRTIVTTANTEQSLIVDLVTRSMMFAQPILCGASPSSTFIPRSSIDSSWA